MDVMHKRSAVCPLLIALLVTHGGVAFAAPAAPVAGSSHGITTVPAQPDTPVDCKKTPKAPECKEKKK